MVIKEPVSDAGDVSKPAPKSHIGRVVALSVLVGLLLALVLALIIFGGGTEPTITGVVLLSFAAGWGLLAWLSTRRTDQPQRWALIPAAFFGVLGLAISETAAANAMPGQLVDVGGFKMHISCTGSGSPTVILEPGLGEPGVMMAGWIQPVVATTTKVCIYDRPGKGFSEPAPTPPDAIANAGDLHTLLARAQVSGPCVLVGHSSGGPYVKVYASE
jgi:hypothetical protein